MTSSSDAAKTLMQVLAVACAAALFSMIFHKAYVDVSALAEANSGAQFWLSLARYFLRNLAGGAPSDS
jgi:hypothetical protein